MKSTKRIAIIGNSGGGKTSLAKRLQQIYKLPLTHVDSIQFIAGMKIRPHSESIAILEQIQKQDDWIIDGYGPLDILESRLQLADKIIFIDFPLWRHYWWCSKRQIKNLFSPRKCREELPDDCNEISWNHTCKLYRTLWKVHSQMRPEMLRILQKETLKEKVIWIRNLSQWRAFSQ